eukprot:comp18135_c0_seq1/m.18864 comp18135_c0_seq1/g.18864  ORF comp18135_c0_seq1/g.18864 comp18135_c0_seq1/m.18864 type:complete len:205 (-) comp18135_c0_seq1:268-882(-)
MVKYELHYYAAQGRVEPIRLALAAVGAEFENVVPDWPADKEKYPPFNQLPVLVEIKESSEGVEKKHIPQFTAIVNHIARKYGLYGENEEERTMVDVVGEAVRDMFQWFIDAWYLEPDAQKEKMRMFNDEYLPKQLVIFEKMISASGTWHVVGCTLTMADILLVGFFTGPYIRTPKTEGVQKLIENVEAIPSVREYLISSKRFKA